MYKVRVAASGQKIAVYQNDKILKVIYASDDTFKPAEAVKYAEELNNELQKTAEQMQDPAGEITTPTKAEQQSSDLPKTQAPATGVGGPDIMAIQAKLHEAQKAIQNLHVENAKLKEASTIERKARRGLAIARHEASINSIASTESAIESRVMEITAMSDEDISLLERKTAGLTEFETPQHAQKYATAQKVKSRIYRQAAEEAMEDGSEEEAIKQEAKAAYCEHRASEAEMFVKKAEMGDVNDDQDEAMNLEMGTSDQFKNASDSDPDNDGDDDTSPETDTDNDMDKMSSKRFALGNKLASLYTQASKCLSKIAEDAEDDDNEEVAEEAKKEARLARKNASILKQASDDEDEDDNDEDFTPEASSLSNIYKKIAKTLTKIAEEAEDEDEDVAEEAYKEAKIARKNASILVTATDDEDEDDQDGEEMTPTANVASLYRTAAKYLSKIAEDADDAGDEETAEDAKKEARLARKNANKLHTASDDEDEDDDTEDEINPTAKKLASIYKKVATQLSKIAEDTEDEDEKEEFEDQAKTAMKKAKVLAKSAGFDDFDSFDENQGDDEFNPPTDIIDQVEDDAEGEAPNMNYSAELTNLYTKIAEQHKQIAKQAEEEGNEEVVQEATAEAEDAEKKASIFQNATATKQVTSESLISLYEKVASYLEKIAEDAEENDQEAVADEADQEAKSARNKANILRTASDDEDADDEDMDMSETGENKTASDDTSEDDDMDFSTEDDGEEKQASKIASIKSHSNGVEKIASVEVNKVAFDPSVESLSSQLWGKKTAE